MLALQLPFDIVLCCSALVSAAVFAYDARPKEGKVQLPTYDDGELEYIDDPFDVTKPEDTIDGYPIREHEFWARVSSVLLYAGTY